jgi:GxxExxY protein
MPSAYLISHKGAKAQRLFLRNKSNSMYSKLSEREEWLGKEIVDAAYKVHRELGPGLLEKIYEACFCYELEKRGIPYKRQVELPFYYDGKKFDEGLRMDVLVDDLVICELKSVENINPLWQAQIISHLKLTKLRLGYLINFNVTLIKNGIKRFIV